MNASEFNFDGLIGPTHNFGGLSLGNLPSTEHRHQISHPKAAALQGLKKMKLLHDLGVKQALIPPQERPSFEALHARGYVGSEQEILKKLGTAKKLSVDDFQTLLECSSSSFMWVANAATISPSSDSGDGRVHVTPANLVTQSHRTLEVSTTSYILSRIFSDTSNFTQHPALENNGFLFDEGAANHMRLCAQHSEHGIEVFVYGKESHNPAARFPLSFPARQSLEASQAVERNHVLDDGRVIFAKQNPDVIDLGVFHNDLISTSNESVLLFHRLAFERTGAVVKEIKEKFEAVSDRSPFLIEVSPQELSVEEAVRSFFFNAQIVTLSSGEMALISPEECRTGASKNVVDRILAEDNPITQVHFVDLKESMSNGGGPACLRLRVVLKEKEVASLNQNYMFNADRYQILVHWVERHYRNALRVEDLADPALLKESRRALNDLTQLLDLGNIYAFQK